jgi:hypothetical protein
MQKGLCKERLLHARAESRRADDYVDLSCDGKAN